MQIIRKIGEWTWILISMLILWVIGLMILEVVLRYAFNSPTIWIHETSQQIYAAFFLLGGAYAVLTDAHVGVDIVYRRLGTRTRLIADVIAYLFLSLFCFMLVWKGGTMAWKSILIRETSPTWWGPPVYPIKSIIPLSGLLVWLLATVRFIVRIAKHEAFLPKDIGQAEIESSAPGTEYTE